MTAPDPTAGERCPMGCLGHGGQGVCPHCGDWHADNFSCCPGTPSADDASEVEALAKVLADARTEGEWIAMSAWHRTCFESDATRLLASDWLAAREAAARAAERERIAQAIEAAWPCDADDAARIAREVRP